jgi:outer membrane lipoprotein-sorting protein
MKLIRTLFAFLILAPLATTLLNAEAFDLDKFLSDMEKSEKTVNSVSFDYTHELIFTLTNETQSSAGEAVFLKPDNIYVKQLKPVAQTIITNGSKVWIFTPGYNQVIQDSWKKWAKSALVPASLVNMGQNWKELRQKYTFSYLATDGQNQVLLLTGKRDDSWKLKLWVDSASFVVDKMILSGENVSITTLASNYKINDPEVDKAIFDFKPPKGVEIMKMP